MSVQYRISCGCGQSLLVNDAQAGSKVSCACGATIEVPKLRELRKLPQEAAPLASQSVRQPADSWNSRQAALFVAGAVTFLALLVSGVMILGRARLDSGWTPELQRTVDDEFVDALEPAQTIGAYQELRKSGLGEPHPASYMLNRETHQKLGGLIQWSLAVAGLGAVAWLVVAFVVPKK